MTSALKASVPELDFNFRDCTYISTSFASTAFSRSLEIPYFSHTDNKLLRLHAPAKILIATCLKSTSEAATWKVYKASAYVYAIEAKSEMSYSHGTRFWLAASQL